MGCGRKSSACEQFLRISASSEIDLGRGVFVPGPENDCQAAKRRCQWFALLLIASGFTITVTGPTVLVVVIRQEGRGMAGSGIGRFVARPVPG
jgi:hypothetical protein